MVVCPLLTPKVLFFIFVGKLVAYISQTDLEQCIESLHSDYTGVYINVDGKKIAGALIFQNMADLSFWTDKAPITVSLEINADIVLEMFVKLGMRSLIVTDKGIYKGMLALIKG